MTVSTLPAAVLFDMDGTLVDTERHWWTAVCEVAESVGRPIVAADDEEHVTGRPTRYTAEYLVATAAEATADDLTARLIDRFTDLVDGDTTPLPGVVDILDALAEHGIPTAIVSASPRAVVEMVRRRLGADLFTLVVGEEDTARSKPAPDPYLAAAARLGVDPGTCVAVEDSPVGTAAAHAAGCRVLRVTGDDTGTPPGVLVRTSLVEVDLAEIVAHANGGVR